METEIPANLATGFSCDRDLGLCPYYTEIIQLLRKLYFMSNLNELALGSLFKFFWKDLAAIENATVSMDWILNHEFQFNLQEMVQSYDRKLKRTDTEANTFR